MLILILQAVKDIYLFAIVAVLVLIDAIIMIPATAISSAVLRREQREIERDNVCSGKLNKIFL